MTLKENFFWGTLFLNDQVGFGPGPHKKISGASRSMVSTEQKCPEN